MQQEYLDMGGEDWRNESQIAEKIASNQWLLDQKIPMQNLEIGQQGFYFVYYLLSHWMNYFIIILIGLFFFDFLSTEYERRNYLFVATQPISKKIFFWRKFAMSNMIFVGSLGILLTIGFIMASFIHGTGSLQYPMILTNGSAFKLIPLREYLLKTILLKLLFISFSIGLLLLLSKWLKNSLEVLGFFFIMMLLPAILEQLIPGIKEVSRWLPASFMNTNVKIVESIGHVSNSYLSVFSVLLSWNLILGVVWCWTLRGKRG